MMNLNYNTVIQYLFDNMPEFRESDDLKSISDSLDLPTVVFGVLSNFYEKNYAQDQKEIIEKISKFLESISLQNDPGLRELLLTGFLENLNSTKTNYFSLRETFVPETKKLLTIVEAG